MSCDSLEVFRTARLVVMTATVDDVELYYRLWTHPGVMVHVGYPHGMPISREAIRDRLSQSADSVLGRLLRVNLLTTGESIGECFMHPPDTAGIARTDVKLLPEYWGHGYGVEIKRGLLEYLFGHTDCAAVEASPNVNNLASVKMQEAVGGRRIGTATYEFPPHMSEYTIPIQLYIYRVFRADWQSRAT